MDSGEVQECRLPESGSQMSLTRHEWGGLTNKFNLADGHARLGQSAEMREIVRQMPEVFTTAGQRSQIALEREFAKAYFTLASQPSVLERELPLLQHYSSSLAIETVANVLRRRGMRVGVLHPTFDNIPAILRRHGVNLKVVSERIFSHPADQEFYRDVDALLLVVPNNPTGADPGIDILERIALACKAAGLLLILDFSFRFFSRHLATSDFYAFLAGHNVAHIGIEDTGKTWPTLDLKVGTLIADASCHAELQAVTDDLLLNVSPFVFALLTEYIHRDGARSSLRVEERNRALLSDALSGAAVALVDAPGPMGVAWLRLPDGWVDVDVVDWLTSEGVAVLPGSPFFWADRGAGASYLRVAMMRPENEFARGVSALVEALSRYRPQNGNTGGAAVGAAAERVGLERLVLTAVGELLGSPDPALEDDFFALGGDSLNAMHLVGRLAQESGLPLRVKLLFDGPVLGDFVDRIAEVRERERQGTAGGHEGGFAGLRAAFATQSGPTGG